MTAIECEVARACSWRRDLPRYELFVFFRLPEALPPERLKIREPTSDSGSRSPTAAGYPSVTPIQ